MKRILKYPFFYNFYQNIIGCKSFLKKYSQQYLKIEDNQSVLDLGCGTGNVCCFLPQNIDYVGIDISPKYIDYASKKYPNFNFHCQSLDEKINLNKTFDVIYGEAILAGLTDDQCKQMFETIVKHSKKTTRIILSDMNYSDDASFIKKLLFSSERNSNVRDREKYLSLFAPYFEVNKISVINEVYRIPYSKLVFECSLKN